MSSTLTELRSGKHAPRQARRRWFRSQDQDLIVWYREDGAIRGFQLCYDRQGEERALTWLEDKGYTHLKVDDGEGVGLAHKQSPILVPDGTFDPQALLERFLAVARDVPLEIVEFVAARLKAYPDAPIGA